MLREVFEKGKELADKVTNVVMNYTDVEAKVRSATNDDPWGPHGQDMQEIAEYTKHYDTLTQVMGMLWRRMFQERKSNWRRTYKSLLLLSYLLRNGSERIVASCKEHMYDLRLLESYQYIDENGKDQGVNIRHRAKDLIALLENESNLSGERKKAAMNRNKYHGVNSGSMNGFKYNYDDEFRVPPQGRSSTPPMTSTNGDIKTAIDIKPVIVQKPVPVAPEPVEDLLDLSSTSVPKPAQDNLLVTPSKGNDTFDPFNLSVEPKSFTVPPIPSQPTSPVKLNNNNRYSDDFDNFVSAPLPTGTSTFNDLDSLFGDFSSKAPTQTVVQPEPVFTSNAHENKTPTIGSTWSNVGSIDISLDLLGNRRRPTNTSVTSSMPMNQLQQQQSLNKFNSGGKNQSVNPIKQHQPNLFDDNQGNFNSFLHPVSNQSNNHQNMTFNDLLS